MPALSPAFVLATASALLFAYLTGVTDSANVIAPVISSRAARPRRALWMTACAVGVAPFIFGVAVARTFGAGVLVPASVTAPIVAAATLSAVAWRGLTWWLGVPSSATHALVGGLLGAGLAGAGLAAVNFGGLAIVLISLFVSPAVGLLAGFALTRLIYFLAQRATPRVNALFRYAQVATALTLALSWGANDAQKTIGLLALGLAAASDQPFTIPLWTTLASMAMVVLGTLTAGTRLVRTIGGKFYKIRPVHGLAAQLSAAGVILSGALVGGPVSTTQVVSTAILGAGAADRLNMVRWGVAGDIAWAWVLTIPASALLGAGMFLLVHRWLV